MCGTGLFVSLTVVCKECRQVDPSLPSSDTTWDRLETVFR